MRLHPRLGAVTAALVIAATTAVAVTAVFVGTGAAYADGPIDAGITVHKIDGLPGDFINGVDVSSILSEEASGVVFRDFDGNVADPFDVLAQAGINYVRVRVWNDPFNADGDGYGAGNVDVDRATQIGERATAAGMKVLVDFHYSDFWADPGKQKAPKAWAGYTVAQTADAVEDFTAGALQHMKDAGVDVGMVQVGNETNGAVAGVTGMSNEIQIFSAGSAAVRSVLPDALVALHFTNPETGGLYAGYAAALDAANVAYDVFASSYYPYWHGTTQNLTSVLSDIALTYHKKVMVAETSWAYTLDDGDGTPNTITAASDTSMYPVSVQGQATEIRDVMAAVNAVPDGAGLGVFYWEPAWIPVPGETLADRQETWAQFGSGWATVAASEYDSSAPTDKAAGSGWDNQALFAYDGTPLESLLAFTYARTGAVAPLAVTGVDKPTLTFTTGDAIVLPSTVAVSFNDGSTTNVAVTWDDVLGLITSAGTYTVNGVTADGATTATVIVKDHNYLVNGDFESGDATGWNLSADPWPSTFWVYASEGNNAQGTYAVNAYDASAFAFHVEQTVTGLAPGTYIASGQAHGQNVTPEFFATTSDGTLTQTPTLTGWQAWKKAAITVTVPADGTLTVGVDGTGVAAGWAWFDEFSLVKAPESPADTSDLQALVHQMGSLVRSVYSADSLAGLDSALEVATIVLAASDPTQDQVETAIARVSEAFDALVVVGDVPDPTVTPVTVTVRDGDAIVLPEAVTVTAFDGRTHSEPVTWKEALSYIDGAGTYLIHGVSDGGYPAVATVTVTQRNWVVNGSFEEDDTSMWTVTGTGGAIGWSGDSADGEKSVAFWLDSDFAFSVSQQVTGLPAGSYLLSATAQGDDEADGDTHEVKLSNGTQDQSAQLGLNGWQAFDTATTAAVAAADGTLTVSAEFTLTAGAWGTVDDFTLVKAPNNADLADLEAAVADGEGVSRSLYEPASLVDLDNALGAYALVAQADDPSQGTVDGVAHWIRQAISNLDLIDVPFTAAPTPTITGAARYGGTLTASEGAWVPTPSGIAYQWKRNGAVIAGANGRTYSPVFGDIGADISVTVTASKADYITVSKTSAAVTIGKGVFTTQPRPAISGTPVAGKKLTVVAGTWSPAAAAYQVQWYRDGKAMKGQTGKTYTIRTTDSGHKISVKVTALKTGFTPASKTSASVKIVKRFRSTGYASISGTAKVGRTLTGHRGIWSPAPTSFSFQWYRNGVAIPGATKVTYKLTSADKGKKVTLKVTVKRAGYLSASHTSGARVVR